jgi:hypothetical protein
MILGQIVDALKEIKALSETNAKRLYRVPGLVDSVLHCFLNSNLEVLDNAGTILQNLAKTCASMYRLPSVW